MIIKNFVKKLVFFLLFIALIFGGNFFLREKHIKEAEATINRTQKKLSDLGVTLGISTIKISGRFFWDVNLDVESELYITTSDSILYFYMPSVNIHSIINPTRDIKIDMTFPNSFTGNLDLNGEVAAKMNLDRKYKLFLQSKNIPIAHIEKEGFDGKTTFNLELEDVVLDVEGSQSRERLLFMKDVNVQSRDLTINATKLNAKIHDLNIYLDEKKFGKHLPKSISFNDGSKNIEWALDLLTTDSVTENNSLETLYKGNMNCITKAFEIKVDGEDRAIKPKDERKYHKSDLEFSVKHFDTFIDYFTSLMLSNKETELEKRQLIESSNLFAKIVKENSRKNDDIASFRIKDTDDKETLFEGKRIEKVFSEFIEKLQD